ncbi:MAG: glycoside hydrolase family 27 protein, partial [Trebonia sp.]
GYNTWYEYRTSANEADVLKQASLLVSTGLAQLGYRTVNLDDGWMAAERTASGALMWNTSKFPHGIPWLAAQLHSMGLNLGIYEAIGTRTCQGMPGSWNHYAQDAQTFASWGVNFVKVDECGGLPSGTSIATQTQYFQQYGADLRRYNPSVIYAEDLPIDAIGTPDFLATVRASSTFANMWRVTNDEYPLTHVNASPMILSHLAADLHLHAFAGPGHWNDLDMVAPDMPSTSWTITDLQNQLSVWAEEASPLLISADLSRLTPAELSALQNPHIINIDQSGSQSPKAIKSGHVEALMKGADGGLAVLYANIGTGTATARFKLSQFGFKTSRASGYNVWKNKTTTFSGITVTLGAGQTALVVMKGL